jgi:hypothetical protein
MIDTLISFNNHEILRIEQIVIDQDEPGALRYIESLRQLIKRRQTGCNPLEFRTREGVDDIIGQTKKNQ